MRENKKNQNKGLNIIIVGCGKVGFTLIEQLVEEDHNITIIDKNMAKVQALSDLYDIMGYVGNGASLSILLEAGIEGADLFIAVTDSDELNLLCCTVAQQVGNCSTIARVREPDYSKEVAYLRDRLGLDMILNPEMEAAKAGVRLLALPTALEVNRFSHGQAEMIKIKLPPGNMLAGKTLAQLSREFDRNILICGVERGEEVFIPSGDFRIEEGDVVSFLGTRFEVKKFLKNIGFKTNQARDVMIIGGSKAAFYMAEQLLGMNIEVKIIEKDRDHCELLSTLLPKAIIINGDGSDEELLKEEGLAYVGGFVPLTGIDEENVMLTLYAKKNSQAKVITKINHMNFRGVINSLDLGSVIYPSYIVAEAIVAFVRAKKESMDSNIETLYHIFDRKAEAIEFYIRESSGVTSTPLKDLKLKSNLLIGYINRRGRLIFPGGMDTIEIGDRVVIVTTHSGFTDVDDILA